MRILYARPGSAYPDMHAGTDLAMHGLCRMLAARGHVVGVVAIRRTLSGMQASVDRQGGYTVMRTTREGFGPALREMAKRLRPELLLISEAGTWMARLPELFGALPIVAYQHELSTFGQEPPAEVKARTRFLANSETTAAHLKRTLGVDSTVVAPLFGIEAYAGTRRSGEQVLLVSLQRRKGADIVLKLAQARPQRRFTICESWTREPAKTQALREQAARLDNVTVLANQPGLREIYRQTRLLLMPSRSQEAWGRAASEAQICGIPVLASSRGNLPRTVGEGGMTLDPDEPFERWLEAFDRMLDDPALYAELSAKALARGRALLGEVERLGETMEQVLLDAVR